MLVSSDYVNLVLVNIQKSEPIKKKLVTFSDLIARWLSGALAFFMGALMITLDAKIMFE